MARGRTRAMYASDITATNFTREVPNNLYLQTAALGWAADPGGLFGIPKGLRPRHAVGRDAAGNSHSAIIADTTADLWTRSVDSWDIIDNFGATQTVTCTGLVGEAWTF